MGARTNAREAALQMLYAYEVTKEPIETVIRDFWRELPGDAEERTYADALVRGVSEELKQLDELIRVSSRNWRIERMTRIDRNVIRLAAWEIEYGGTVPFPVVLNEAVELAKRYGTEEGASFVNGVLASIAGQRQARSTDEKARTES